MYFHIYANVSQLDSSLLLWFLHSFQMYLVHYNLLDLITKDSTVFCKRKKSAS